MKNLIKLKKKLLMEYCLKSYAPVHYKKNVYQKGKVAVLIVLH